VELEQDERASKFALQKWHLLHFSVFSLTLKMTAVNGSKSNFAMKAKNSMKTNSIKSNHFLLFKFVLNGKNHSKLVIKEELSLTAK